MTAEDMDNVVFMRVVETNLVMVEHLLTLYVANQSIPLLVLLLLLLDQCSDVRSVLLFKLPLFSLI